MAFAFWGYELTGWLIALLIWELVWKAIAMWKSARNNQINWFIFVLVINSFGNLPMIYLQFFQKDKNAKRVEKKKSKR